MGLIYVGEGQYYDPATGRFLTTRAQPGKVNPYVPRGGDASGILLGPLALMVLLKGKRNGRKLSRVNRFIVLLILFILMAMIIAGCRDEPPLPPPVPPTPPNDNNRGTEPPPSAPGTPPPPTSAPTPEPTSSCTPTPTPNLVPLGNWKITHYNYAMEDDDEFPKVSANGESDYVAVGGLDPNKKYRRQFIYSSRGIPMQGTGLAEDGVTYITIDWTRNNAELNPNWINGNTAEWFFTYGKGGRFAEGKPWESVAISVNETTLVQGQKLVIDIYPDKVFTVTDTGTFPDTNHFDVFIGSAKYADTLNYGTIFEVPVWLVK